MYQFFGEEEALLGFDIEEIFRFYDDLSRQPSMIFCLQMET
jgi:hypothetical protein